MTRRFVAIPTLVQRETVEAGKKRKIPDALVIEENINAKKLRVETVKGAPEDLGENAALALFRQKKFDAIGNDDKKFLKKLRILQIPYVTPATFIFLLVKRGTLTKQQAMHKIDALTPYVSDDEISIVRLFVEKES